MLTLTSFRSCSLAIRSSTGATAWHGPHHSAQKSTRTLPSEPRTSSSNVDVVAVVAIPSFPEFQHVQRRGGNRCSPVRKIESMFTPLSDKPDHTALELEVLELWEREGTFEQLRERN